LRKFPFYRQIEEKDCGPTCIKMIAEFYGKKFSSSYLRTLSETQRWGTNLANLSDAADQVGLKSLCAGILLNELKQAPLPCIIHWNNNHYVVLFNIKSRRSKETYYVADPAHGIFKYNQEDFTKGWIAHGANGSKEKGVVLLLEPTGIFYDQREKLESGKLELGFLKCYLIRYKQLFIQLGLSLFLASFIQLIFPFLTQSIVDIGIQNQDISFVYLILLAQLFLFIGKLGIELIRGRILLHLSTRINISLVSDFLIKIMRLPISFFDTRMTGDILQRIIDHKRIEHILTNSSISIIFSLFNLVIFSFVLAYYNLKVFWVFLIGTGLYVLWILFFLKRRRNLDYIKFSQQGKEQSKIIEIINGMQEIKLHNAEKQKRWSWEGMQAQLFKLSIQELTLEEYQNIGSYFINEVKNILITIIAAGLVITGELTLGMMLAISYIVGQLNSPVYEAINFARELQDARISLERLSAINQKEEERQESIILFRDNIIEGCITLKDVSFRYPGMKEDVLQNISLSIQAQKTTAIVGESGSGKTSLMKLLLQFYESFSGEIKIGNADINNLNSKLWRNNFGVVMQDGYIFNDTIARNIAIGQDFIDRQRLLEAVYVTNCKEFIESLPLSYNTEIGNEGMGLSGGQKQRILLARAVYKDPPYLFLDEATSSLDSRNEVVIIERLNDFFKNKTVVVIAHRLSTVKNADQIVVLNKGCIAEIGIHSELVKQRSNYYDLIKNQLELGV
tara:strand:+ start:4896 stop:7097 length:2202 start_codon:yes stop_codon:yes gene_type:complete